VQSSENPASLNSTQTTVSRVQYSEVNIVCRVTNIKKQNNKYVSFTVYSTKSKRYFECTANFYLPIRINDVIGGPVLINCSTYGLTFNVHPMVIMPKDSESVKAWIMDNVGGRINMEKATSVYSKVSSTIRGHSTTTKNSEGAKDLSDLVDREFDNLAYLWNRFDRVGNLDGESFSSINRESELLSMFSGHLSKSQTKRLFEKWYRDRSLRRLFLLSMNLREIKSLRFSPRKIHDQCSVNPLVLIPISIEKANIIASRFGVIFTKEQLRTGEIARILYKDQIERGWTCTPSSSILSRCSDLTTHLNILKTEYKIVAEMHSVYLEYPHTIEKNIAQAVLKWSLLEDKGLWVRRKPSYLCGTLNEEQKKAVTGSLDKHISIITGGAGTGKTTLIKELIHNLQILKRKYILASFTGKAVSRIRDVTGAKSASTLHRLISDSKRIPPFDFIIIDEASMVTMPLFYSFCMTFDWAGIGGSKKFDIILVGDDFQLPPVEWGSLLRQLILSKVVKIFKLDINHRSDLSMESKDGILANATGIKEYAENGQQIFYDEDGDEIVSEPFKFQTYSNFFYFPGDVSVVKVVINSLIEKGISSNDITVITPYNECLQELNIAYQNICHMSNKQYVEDYKGRKWHAGDRVMMNENSYKINVFNGEEGIVISAIGSEIVVQFRDGIKHLFTTEMQDTSEESWKSFNKYKSKQAKTKEKLPISLLDHSFAVTIHKAQGSEWEYVIFYIPPTKPANTSFVDRNLVYTAITRARRAVFLIGNKINFDSGAIKRPSTRVENLAKRLKTLAGVSSPEPTQKSKTPVN